MIGWPLAEKKKKEYPGAFVFPPTEARLVYPTMIVGVDAGEATETGGGAGAINMAEAKAIEAGRVAKAGEAGREAKENPAQARERMQGLVGRACVPYIFTTDDKRGPVCRDASTARWASMFGERASFYKRMLSGKFWGVYNRRDEFEVLDAVARGRG